MAARKKVISITAAILLALLVAPVFQVGIVDADPAEDVWVAPPPLGSDSNPGTQAQPFATIQHGIDNVDLYGTVHITAGTYHENLLLTNDVWLEGAGAPVTIVDGGDLGTVIVTEPGYEYMISGLTIQNGLAQDLGAQSDRVLFAGLNLPFFRESPQPQQPIPIPGAGGGILIAPDSLVDLYQCVIKDNQALYGGGICNTGLLFMGACTVSGNAAYMAGGGILNVMPIGGTDIGENQLPFGLALLFESTISGNTIPAEAEAGASGAGILNEGAMFVVDCTIANNTAVNPDTFGGGFYNILMAFFGNTIVANNTAGTGNNGYNTGTVASEGYNLDSENSCGFDDPTDLVNTNPVLGPLQDNGGPTFTHALYHGSPAIDSASCADFFIALGPQEQGLVSPQQSDVLMNKVNQFFPDLTDQRGVPRPQGEDCDRGAYELAQASAVTTTNSGTTYFSTLNGYITDLTALGESQTDCGPISNFYFPYGLFSFNVADITPGSTATVVIILPENIPTGAEYWKCLNGQWVNCTALLGSNDGDSVLTLTITDGGLGDGDGSPNGTIADPGGPVLVTTQAGPNVSPTLPRLLNTPQMSVQYLSVSPQQAANNSPVTISANVVNTGDQGGNLNVALKINGKIEQTKMVSVGPQASQPIKFTVARSEPGTYSIDVGGQSGSFTIPDSHANKGAPANTGMIIFLIMAVLAIVVAMVLLLNHRSA